MNKKRIVALFAVLGIIGAYAACGGGKPKTPAGTTPIDELIAAGKSPVQVSRLSRGISPVAPTFSLTVKNVSDAPVKMVQGTVIFFDGQGKALADTVQETGYSELSPIDPGGQVELSLMTKNENAVTGEWIIKTVAYEKVNPKFKEYGAMLLKWTNPNFDAELEAAKAK